MKININKKNIFDKTKNILNEQLKIYKNNEPLNRKDNNIKQADLELENIKSIEASLKLLNNQ
jgi:hypothetical protein